MSEGTNLMLNTDSNASDISYKSFKIQNLPMQNSYCDHRNFDSVILCIISRSDKSICLRQRNPAKRHASRQSKMTQYVVQKP